MNEHYPHLLEPLTVRGGTLRNRVVMGSMHTGLEDRPWHVPHLAAYVAERARGGVGLIVTGGYSPDVRGWLLPFGSQMSTRLQAERHKQVTAAVHAEGGAIALQLLHAGRYGYTPFSESASATRSPITPFKAGAMSTRRVEQVVRDFADAARLAKRAGYDGVEIMGSEGYLLNQFMAPERTSGTTPGAATADKRMRLPVEVVRAVREAVGEDMVVMYRMSLLDLVPEAPDTGRERRARPPRRGRGRSLNTGIGWHEARVPTILTQVPRGRGPGPPAGCATRSASRSARRTGSTPPTSPRPSSPTAARTWCRWRGRSSPTRTSWRRPLRVGPTRSTRASPATRPASTTPSPPSAPPAW